MNVHVLVPLIATIAYIPLLIILLTNRPWQSQQKLFFLFLIPAVLWSAIDIFFRGDFLMPYKLPLVKAGLCTAIWMIIQYRYFLQSFYKSDVARKPFGYIFLAAFIVLAILGYIPRDITVTTGGIDVDYGVWLLVVAASLLIITSRDIYLVIRKLRVSADAVERNQIIYLFVGLICLAVFGLVSLSFSAAARYPLSHIGNFLNACVLTYAVVTHRLVDIRVVFRHAFINIVLYGGGLAILLLLFWLAQRLFGFEIDFASLAATIGLGIPAILLLVHKVRGLWERKVETAFIGVRSAYRRQLSQFITGIHNVPTLEELGSEFISLLAQSIDCRRACLLLPQPGHNRTIRL